jgi:hypothetical protein
MRPALWSSRPRHLAGKTPQDGKIDFFGADFDVDAALEPESDFDFEGLFLADEDDDLEPALAAPRRRIARHKIAFAVSVTLAALPLLVLDNFQSAAESPTSKVDAQIGGLHAEVKSDTPVPERLPTNEVPPVSVDVTIAKATVFVSDPAPTTTDAPTTTTTEKPDPPTTTTVKVTTTIPAPLAAASVTKPDADDVATWDTLAKCESNGNWAAVSEERSGVRYYGGLQFSLATWQDLGGTGAPNEASKAAQIEIGKKLQARQGWDAWPTCARKLGWT